MSFQFTDLITAMNCGFPYFYIQTWEVLRAVDEVISVLKAYTYPNGDKPYIDKIKVWDFSKSGDPEEVIQYLAELPSDSVIIAKNFNWFLGDGEEINKGLVSFLQNNFDVFGSQGNSKTLIVVSNDPFETAIPAVLSKDFRNLSLDTPGREEIKKMYDFIMESAKDNPKFVAPSPETEDAIISAAMGLTSNQVKKSFAFAMVKDQGKMSADTVGMIRKEEVEKTPGLSIGEYKDVDCPIGYEVMKNFCLNSVNDQDGLGVLILGSAGTGKTSFTHWLASKTGCLVINLQPERLEGGGLVGQKEAAWNLAIDVIKAIAKYQKVIVLIDEIEKGLAGVGSSVSAISDPSTQKATSTLLKFLSDERPKNVWVAATCNDISQMPAAWLRAERWDCAPFFVPLPGEEAKKKIFDYYIKKYNEVLKNQGSKHVIKYKALETDGWSGAECKALVRLAKNQKVQLEEVLPFIKPVSQVASQEYKALTEWATESRVVFADKLPTIKKQTETGKQKLNF